jgi:hypothetical protein
MSNKKPRFDNNNNTKTDFEIPGFYYDQEKKKYFKIQPNHQQQTNLVTNDVIEIKKQEDDLKKNLNQIKSTNLIKNILLVRELGILDRKYLYDERNNYKISNLKRKSSFEIQNGISYTSQFKFDTKSDYIYLLANSLSSTIYKSEYLVTFFKIHKSTGNVFNVRSNQYSYSYSYSTNQYSYTDNSSTHAYVHDNEYLVKTRHFPNQNQNVQSNYSVAISRLSLFNKNESENRLRGEQIILYDFSKDFLCTRLNSCFQTGKKFTKFSIGFFDHAEVVVDNRSQYVNTLKSDVYCQQFHPIVSNFFFRKKK